MRRRLAAGFGALFLTFAGEAMACEDPPRWAVPEPAPGGKVLAVWPGGLYRIDPADGQFAQIAELPPGAGSLCFSNGDLYIVSAKKFAPSIAAVLKTVPLPFMEPHRDVRPGVARLENGVLTPIAEGPRLTYHYGAVPLAGDRAAFIGYRQGAMIVVDQDGTVWRRQAMANPTILQRPAAMGLGSGGRLHALVASSGGTVVTTFDLDGRVTREVRLDLPQDYRRARGDGHFVRFLGVEGGEALFSLAAWRKDRGDRRSPPLLFLIAVARDGEVSVRPAPAALLADHCSTDKAAIHQGRVALLCTVANRPSVVLWSLASGQVRSIEVKGPLIDSAGFVKHGLLLASRDGAGFVLMTVEAGARGLHAVQVQPIE